MNALNTSSLHSSSFPSRSLQIIDGVNKFIACPCHVWHLIKHSNWIKWNFQIENIKKIALLPNLWNGRMQFVVWLLKMWIYLLLVAVAQWRPLHESNNLLLHRNESSFGFFFVLIEISQSRENFIMTGNLFWIRRDFISIVQRSVCPSVQPKTFPQSRRNVFVAKKINSKSRTI